MRHGLRHIGGAVFGAVVAMLLLLPATPVLAQGFNVQPMMMEAAHRPGQTVELPLRLNNTSASSDQTIELRLVELTQTPQGSWYIVNPDSGEGPPHNASLLDWVSLEDDRITVPAAGGVETIVNVNVPRNARGTYFGALIAETPRPADASGLVVRVRFLIPIIVQIQGRAERQQVELEDITLLYDDGEESSLGPTTRAFLHIRNKGRTYSRVRGRLTVERQAGERWRPVTRIELPSRSIIPGVVLELGEDLQRRLPSGTYRLRGELRIDGRRARAIEREIEFTGDPNVDSLAYDVALLMDPEIVRLDVAPGATRTAAVSVQNPGEDPITVRMVASIPEDLRGVAIGDLRGDVYSAEPWTEIRPTEFTVRPGGRRNVRILSRVPQDDVGRANYYADLVLEGRYEDGQSAGVTRSIVHLAHRGVEAEPGAMIERLLVAEGDEPSEHFVQARFVNIGNVHLEPTGDIEVLSGRGTAARARLAAEPGPLLPLGKRSFSAAIDFAGVEPGYYVVRATFGYGFGQSTADQLLIEVVEEADTAGQMVRRVVVLDDLPEDEALPELDVAMPPAAEE